MNGLFCFFVCMGVKRESLLPGKNVNYRCLGTECPGPEAKIGWACSSDVCRIFVKTSCDATARITVLEIRLFHASWKLFGWLLS